jgi:hypothetical protein
MTYPYVQIDPEEVQAFVQRKKAVFEQYSTPGMTVPADEASAAALCERILTHLQNVMGSRIYWKLNQQVAFSSSEVPVYIISSNRSQWLMKNCVKHTFAGRLIGKRPVIFVVSLQEFERYVEAMFMAGLHPGKGVYVMGCGDGFGMSWSRHTAIRHARELRREKLWILDENVHEVGELSDLEDEVLDGPCPFFTYSMRGFLEQVVGINLVTLRSKNLQRLNFCPYFAYNKDDASFQRVFEHVYGIDITGEVPKYGWERPGIFKIPKDPDVARKYKLPVVTPDSTERPKDRVQIEREIAALDIWRTSKDKEEKLAIAEMVPAFDVMKWQSEVMYRCLESPGVAKELSRWFSDDAAAK